MSISDAVFIITVVIMIAASWLYLAIGSVIGALNRIHDAIEDLLEDEYPVPTSTDVSDQHVD